MYNHVIEKQAKLLGITYPFTNSELKNAFNQLAFQYHPDKGGDPQQFIAIKEAYDFLKSFSTDIKDTKSTKITVEGDLLINLGKGLGELVNQKPCSQCHGKGWEYKTHYEYTYNYTCEHCHGKGYINRYYNLTEDDILYIWKAELNGIPRLTVRRTMRLSYQTHEYWCHKLYKMAYSTKVSPRSYELQRTSYTNRSTQPC